MLTVVNWIIIYSDMGGISKIYRRYEVVVAAVSCLIYQSATFYKSKFDLSENPILDYTIKSKPKNRLWYNSSEWLVRGFESASNVNSSLRCKTS